MLNIPGLDFDDPHEKFGLAGNKPWFEFVPGFLENPDEVLAWLHVQANWHKEDGYCPTPSRPMRDQHSTIQWGPRQAYNSCVPPEYRVTSSGPIPEFLNPLTERIEKRYRQPFNSVQVNRHYDHTSNVYPHSDNMCGDIVMISLGAARRFVLRFKKDDSAKTKHRWKAGEIFFDPVMPSGSLLTICAQHQHDLQHELPAQTEPCGERLSMIWRYLTNGNEKSAGLDAYTIGGPEFTAARKDWREKNA